jgi:ATP-dependent DNA helicase RecQ
MRGYAELAACRRQYLLTYFGEDDAPEHCQMCDNDVLAVDHQRVIVIDTDTVEDSQFTPGTSVRHDTWDNGEVLRAENDTVTVLFKTVGYKTLALDLVQEDDLLQII